MAASGRVELVVGDTHPIAVLHPTNRRTGAAIPIDGSGYGVVIRFHVRVGNKLSQVSEKTATIYDDGGVAAAKYAFTATDMDIGPEPMKEADLFWEWRITFPDGTTATTLEPLPVRIRNRM